MENDPSVLTNESEVVKTMINYKPIILIDPDYSITPDLKKHSGSRSSRSGRRKNIRIRKNSEPKFSKNTKKKKKKKNVRWQAVQVHVAPFLSPIATSSCEIHQPLSL